MGILGNLLNKKRVQIIQNNNTVVQFDASIKENHKLDSTPTKFPIEGGQSISDHMILQPQSLELTGIITDTPIGGAEALISEVATTLTSALLPPVGVVAASAAYSLFKAGADSSSPSVAAYGKLLQLQKNAQPVNVYTSLYMYENMWITSISAPRDAETGKSLIFSMTLEQLIIVSPQTVDISVFANPSLSANQADVGDQSGLQSVIQKGRLNGNAAVASGT
jgi:hypothetical protein